MEKKYGNINRFFSETHDVLEEKSIANVGISDYILIMVKEISILTKSRTEMVLVDQEIKDVVRESGVQEGICLLWVPHTTASVTINENADPAVVRDILYEINKVIPFQDGYQHSEGNSAAHIKSSLFGPSLSLIVTGRKLVLGTWQSIYFCEFDGPRTRRMFVKVVEG